MILFQVFIGNSSKDFSDISLRISSKDFEKFHGLPDKASRRIKYNAVNVLKPPERRFKHQMEPHDYLIAA